MSILASVRSGSVSDIPLVLLHAMPMTSRMWEPVVERLGDMDVIRVDAPGFGDSPSGAALDEEYGHSEPSMDSYLSALEETLAAQGVERAVVAGISMGGATAANYALRNPQQVAGLAIIDSGVGAEPANSPRQGAIDTIEHEGSYAVLQKWTHTMLSSATSEEIHAEFDEYFKTVSPEAFAWLQKMMVGRPDGSAVLDAEIPILLVRGVDDPNASHGAFAAMHERAKNSRFEELEGASHFSAYEKPGEVAALLRELYEAAR